MTLSFSGKIGEIMKHVGEDEAGSLQTSYKFYMWEKFNDVLEKMT